MSRRGHHENATVVADGDRYQIKRDKMVQMYRCTVTSKVVSVGFIKESITRWAPKGLLSAGGRVMWLLWMGFAMVGTYIM